MATQHQHGNHEEHANEAARSSERAQHEHTHQGHDHQGHDHAAMIADFRRRFWVSLVLTAPILAFSPMIQRFLGLK